MTKSMGFVGMHFFKNKSIHGLEAPKSLCSLELWGYASQLRSHKQNKSWSPAGDVFQGLSWDGGAMGTTSPSWPQFEKSVVWKLVPHLTRRPYLSIRNIRTTWRITHLELYCLARELGVSQGWRSWSSSFRAFQFSVELEPLEAIRPEDRYPDACGPQTDLVREVDQANGIEPTCRWFNCKALGSTIPNVTMLIWFDGWD